ncbi:MAG TPA: outer membrane beta-barrel protein [Planctomycetota bacterium]|nr:outer membrane beta-barrel protein [Planctomycetota bacterium]
MARNLAAAAMVVAMGSAAWAQDVTFTGEPEVNFARAEPVEWAPLGLGPEFGIRAGYIKPRDADDGTWFGGVQLRVPLGPVLALEGSVEFHTSEFADGDIEVIQYPVQASLLVFLLPNSQVCPYVLGGLGWYYTTTDFSGSLDGLDSETDSLFGAHLGLGARLALGGLTTSVDLRYIFLEPDEDALEDEDFDSIQIVLSLTFPF